MFKSGLAIHCHHDILVECCYNYDERVEVIKSTKPQNEQEIRLRLFKLLPKEAIDELPYEMVKAWAEWDKAWAEWVKAQAGLDKAQAELDKAQAEWVKACAERDKAQAGLDKARAERDKAQAGLDKAWAEWVKACAEWDKADRDNWHKKWCGCKEWNGKEIEFK